MGNSVSRDGAVTKFTEKIPVVGLITAAVQAASGNSEHAKRALANQANAIITTAGTVAGFAVGGPPGAVLGGALASTGGIGAEWAVSTTIDDPNVKGDTGNVSVQRVILDGALAGAGGALGGGSGGTIAKQVGIGFSKEAGKQVGKEAGKSALSTLIGAHCRAATDTISGQISGPSGPVPGEDPDEPEGKKLYRAVTDYQANHGHGFIGLLNQLNANFYQYSPSHAQGSLTDMTNNALDIARYFQKDVLHATCLERWTLVKGDLKHKMIDGTRLEGVRQVINQKANAGEITIAKKESLLATLEQQKDAILAKMDEIDTALAGEAEYCIPQEQLRQPILPTVPGA